MSGSVCARLADYIAENMEHGVPEPVLHEAKRLLLNGLGATVAAYDHPAIQILNAWALASSTTTRPAHVLWSDAVIASEQAALVNTAQWEVLDFNDTYIPTFIHATPAVGAAVISEAETRRSPGRDVLQALAIGIEIAIATSRMLWPSSYQRGFRLSTVAATVGAAAGCAALKQLDRGTTAHALGIAMLSASGPRENVGSLSALYNAGSASRGGVVASQLAELGVDSAVTAFEGDAGMRNAYSDESSDKTERVLDELPLRWRMLEQTYKRQPVETITHAPLECLLSLLARIPVHRRSKVEAIRVAVEPVVATIADERYRRFGQPKSDLEANWDLRYCMAATWITGEFAHAGAPGRSITDPEILSLRDHVIVEPSAEFSELSGARVEAIFEDGTRESTVVEAFRGHARNPLTDEEIEVKFRTASDGRLADGDATDVISSLWKLETYPNIEDFRRLLVAV